MLEIMYKTDVYTGVLLSDQPFAQKSRIRGLKTANWRKRRRIGVNVQNRVFLALRYGLLLGRAWTDLDKILGHDSGMVWLSAI